jgi:hypothetical protein
MFGTLLNALLGCSHKRTTFPLTEAHTARKRTYVTCLDCGREFDYNWKQMKITEDVPAVPVAASMPPVIH